MSHTALAEKISSAHHAETEISAGVSPGKLDILLVEDCKSDIMLTEIALEAAQIECSLHTLSDGNDVVPYLDHQGKFMNERTPDVVLLDLSLPHRDGFELLAELATRQDAQDIPIIIMTGHEHYQYLVKVYGLWLPAYITKPCTDAKIAAALHSLHRPRHNRPMVWH